MLTMQSMRKKRVQRVTVEDFEALIEAVEAKKRMMQQWKSEGVSYAAAVVRYASEQGVTMNRAAESLDDMEVLTGVRLERC